MQLPERSVEPGAVGGADGLLDLGPGPALHVVEVVAVLGRVGGVQVIKGQAVSARLQRGHAPLALPVLVAAHVVRVVALELIWADEVLLGKSATYEMKGELTKTLITRLDFQTTKVTKKRQKKKMGSVSKNFGSKFRNLVGYGNLWLFLFSSIVPCKEHKKG